MNPRGWDAIGQMGTTSALVAAALTTLQMRLGWVSAGLEHVVVCFVVALVPSVIASLPVAVLAGLAAARSERWPPVRQLLHLVAALLAAPALGMLAAGGLSPFDALLPGWLLAQAAGVLVGARVVGACCFPPPAARVGF